jgi:hypothetical protein
MSSGFRPNDQMHLPGLGVPIDPWTGHLLPATVVARLKRLREAERDFRLVLHELDGSTEGSRPGNRRMAIAFTCLEEAALWCSTAILHGED